MGPCQPGVVPSVSWTHPGTVDPIAHRSWPEVGVLNVTTGADPTNTVHGTVANVVTLPAGSVSVAVTSFWPRVKSTAENGATPVGNDVGMYVRVDAPFVTCNVTPLVSALNVTACVTVVDDIWTLPHRFAGVATASAGATGSTHPPTGMLMPTLAGWTASVTCTRSSVDAASVPPVFSVLLGSVPPLHCVAQQQT